MEDNLIYYGGAVKVLGDGKVGGYLVRYTSANEPDLEGDYFSKDTDLGIETGSRLPVYYQHGYDPVFKTKRIGRASVEFQDVGVWLEAQLEMRDEYERSLMELAEAGKLGWSSGAAGHLVERELVEGKSYFIKSWPIAEASLTPTPAEPRNAAVSVKTLTQHQPDQVEPEPDKQEVIMTEEVKAPEVKQELDIAALIKEAVDSAVKKMRDEEPKVKAGNVDVIEDEADKALRENPFKPTEFFKAVYRAEVYSDVDKRLLPLKATGANEAIPSEGGFLVTPDIAAGITENMWGVGSVLERFNAISVSGNGLTINAIDETSRAAGSRMGGVRGYWLNEGGEKTASQPTLRQIELKLKKVAALVYATDELLQDATALEGWIVNNVPNELRFMVEDSIIDGNGIGMPLGILRSGALVEAVRTDANQIDAADIARMWAARYVGPNDYVWFANASIMPQIYQLQVGNVPVYQSGMGGYANAPYGTIFGRPVIENEYCPYLGSVGDLLLASPSQYALITKGGIQSASSIHVKFEYDETAFRFVYRVDGEPIWASSVTAFDGTATISPFVALAATT